MSPPNPHERRGDKGAILSHLTKKPLILEWWRWRAMALVLSPRPEQRCFRIIGDRLRFFRPAYFAYFILFAMVCQVALEAGAQVLD